MAWSRNALNLISALHSTSGFGVRPAEYSRRNSANTRSLYSAEKLTASSSLPLTSAAAAALVASAALQFLQDQPAAFVSRALEEKRGPRRIDAAREPDHDLHANAFEK